MEEVYPTSEGYVPHNGIVVMLSNKYNYTYRYSLYNDQSLQLCLLLPPLRWDDYKMGHLFNGPFKYIIYQKLPKPPPPP